jgi:hypothetical protein
MKRTALITLLLGCRLAEAEVIEISADVTSLVTFDHVGPDPVQWGVDVVASVIFSSMQMTFENEAIRTHPPFAFNSSSGDFYFQSSDFTWDDSGYSPFYWFWDVGFQNGAKAGINYVLLDVDDNGRFETLVEIDIPSNAGPPGLENADSTVQILRYFFDSDANSVGTAFDLSEALENSSNPVVALSRASSGDILLDFTGVLQTSLTLDVWTDIDPQPISPYVIEIDSESGSRFYRARN